MKNLPPQLQPLLARLPQSKSGRIKLGVACAGALLLFIILVNSFQKPAPHVIVPLVKPEQAPVVVDNTPPPPPNADNSKIILELFNPTDQALTHQLTNTTYSEQIEQTMTVSFVLTKCQLISQDDYRDTFRALILYAEKSKLAADAVAAEAAVRQIAEASKASYALIYSRTSCTDPQLPALTNQVLQWTRDMVTPQDMITPH